MSPASCLGRIIRGPRTKAALRDSCGHRRTGSSSERRGSYYALLRTACRPFAPARTRGRRRAKGDDRPTPRPESGCHPSPPGHRGDRPQVPLDFRAPQRNSQCVTQRFGSADEPGGCLWIDPCQRGGHQFEHPGGTLAISQRQPGGQALAQRRQRVRHGSAVDGDGAQSSIRSRHAVGVMKLAKLIERGLHVSPGLRKISGRQGDVRQIEGRHCRAPCIVGFACSFERLLEYRRAPA